MIQRLDIERIEKFCNFVAGEILLPTTDLKVFLEKNGINIITLKVLEVISANFGVSRETALRRLSHINAINYSNFQTLLVDIKDSYSKSIQSKSNSKGFSDYYKTVVRDNGLFFTRLVCDAYETSQITPNDLASSLGINIDHTDRILEVIGRKARRQ